MTVENVALLNSPDWLLQQHNDHKQTLTAISKMLGCSSTTIGRQFNRSDLTVQRFPISMAEREIQSFLTEHNIVVQSNVRNIISPLELDIFLPDYNIAIEYCGLYWHCTKHQRITPQTHKQKLDKCAQVGIRLITIFEDEWLHKQALVIYFRKR